MRIEAFREPRAYAQAAGPLLNADTLLHNALIDQLHFRPADAVYFCALDAGTPILAAQAVPGRPLLLCAVEESAGAADEPSPQPSPDAQPSPLTRALEALARELAPNPPAEAQGPPSIMARLCRRLPGDWALHKRLTLFRADAASVAEATGNRGAPASSNASGTANAPGIPSASGIPSAPGIPNASGIPNAPAATNVPNAAVPGALLRATEPDMAFLPEWDYAMATESGMAAPRTAAHVAMGVRGQVADGRVYLWVSGVPCAMAVHARDAGDAALITTVYTAAAFRRRGFGHACVEALTRLLLDRGYAACALYADAENPVSDRLYRAVGYRVYAQVEHWGRGRR